MTKKTRTKIPLSHIRNFAIIAHIDHGKSTLADRLLQKTGTVAERDMQEQFLDGMDLEREKGITIKAHPVTIVYKSSDGEEYHMHLIDTPGHVDFSYEVSRSLAACEGALIIVDAAQGVQAQTLANVYLAIDRGLEILPVINKIDLPAAEPEKVRQEIEDILGIDASRAILCSAKTGEGIEEILEEIVYSIPPPTTPPLEEKGEETLRALIFDSHYDNYRGVMIYFRVFGGVIEKGAMIRLMATNKVFEVLEVGKFSPEAKASPQLESGEVGYLVANIKKTSDVKIGDTITQAKGGLKTPLPGFQEILPVVFAGIYPVDASDFLALQDSLEKLQLNDSALKVEMENSSVLGMGFRCGFLGLLHLEITFARLQREFSLDIITTSPSVSYRIETRNGKSLQVDNPSTFPDPSIIEKIEEPWMVCRIMSPSNYLGAIMQLANEKRGICLHTDTTHGARLLLTYEFPLNEIIIDFNDRLKSITQGYASFDYEPKDHRKADIVKLEIRINEEPVDAFSTLVHRSKAESKGRALCKRLAEVIPRQQFKLPIQGAIGGKIVARETLSALGKNVTAKCYGGDITRKRKLWEKQKAGKKKMKEIGKVQLPQSTFIEVLKTDSQDR